jgi:hypothetical protein
MAAPGAPPRVGVGVLLERRNAADETEVLVGPRWALAAAAALPPPTQARRRR